MNIIQEEENLDRTCSYFINSDLSFQGVNEIHKPNLTVFGFFLFFFCFFVFFFVVVFFVLFFVVVFFFCIYLLFFFFFFFSIISTNNQLFITQVFQIQK